HRRDESGFVLREDDQRPPKTIPHQAGRLLGQRPIAHVLRLNCRVLTIALLDTGPSQARDSSFVDKLLATTPELLSMNEPPTARAIARATAADSRPRQPQRTKALRQLEQQSNSAADWYGGANPSGKPG